MKKGWYKKLKEHIADLDGLKDELTLKPFMGDEEPLKVYSEDDEYIGVPYNFGVSLWGDRKDRVEGADAEYTHFPDPHHPMAPKGQPEFFSDAVEAIKALERVMVIAGTGTGKTQCGLNTIAKLGKVGLVVVPTNELVNQWVARAISDTALNLSPDDVGMVQQDVCDYVGKKIVVASLKSLWSRTYEPEFYEHFGIVVYDEVHRSAADKMLTTMCLFPAKYQMGLTATLKRSDGKDKALRMWLGEPAVTANGMKPVNVTYNFIPYRHNTVPKKVRFYESKIMSLTGQLADLDRTIRIANPAVAGQLKATRRAVNNSLMNTRKISVSIYKHEIAADTVRTDWLCEILKKLYLKDKVALGISCSTKQLQYAHEKLIGMGVRPEDICIFADQLYTGLKRMSFAVTDKELIGYIKANKKEIEIKFNCTIRVSVKSVTVNGECLNSASTRNQIKAEIKSQMSLVTDSRKREILSKRTRIYLSRYATYKHISRVALIHTCCGEFSIKDKMKKVSKAEIREMLTNQDMKIYLATYGVMSMGVDVPWISCGVDLSPQKEATQVIGRIARIYKGKITAYWFSPYDIGYPSGLKKVNDARKKEMESLSYVTVKERK